jgi:ATP-dependent helicase HepA
MFVESERAREWGIGKLIGRSTEMTKVEYFHHPGLDGRTVRVLPTASIRPRKLEVQTRVFFRRNGRWQAGQVMDLREDNVEIQCGRRPKALIPLADVYVRCDRPLNDPVPFLAAGLSEPHRLSSLRHRFLQEAVLQRVEGAGLEGLLSSCVELLPHQMNVVRQVLTDPVQRYLLADEVGLGKTIEAAAIIRQYVIDDPAGHRVAVVAPEALVSQWRDELARRFHVGPPFLDESVRVVHAHDEELEEALEEARMVVVDEAHHIVSRGPQGQTSRRQLEIIRKACCNAEALLLLSATPAIADEDSFFELMQLIDPEVYLASEREAFHQRIAHRQELAQIIAGFEPALMGFLVEDGKRLQQMFPEDARLAELLETLAPVAREAEDPEQPELVEAVQAVRQHLSETYRLHRRILRNRRKNVDDLLTPLRSGAQRIVFADPTAGHVARQLENWRIDVAEQSETDTVLCELYAEWVRLLLEAPAMLTSAVRRRLEAVRDAAPPEVKPLERLLQHLDAWDPLELRVRALLDAVEKHFSQRCKLVVFCSGTATADRCFQALSARHGQAVVRHEAQTGSDPDQQVQWLRFMRSPDCWMLVCDARAEEGLNLQGGRKAVVHVDLPLAPNRIEQRLGRVDRFGSGDPIRSLVLTCADTDPERVWTDCVIDGFGVMEHSISSLQYLVDAEMESLRRAMGTAGLSAVANLTARLGGESGDIRRELRRIDQQDALEALQSEESESFESLDEADSNWRRVRDAIEPWVQHGLHFTRTVDNDGPPGVDEVVRYRHTGPGTRGTVVPSGRFRADFLGAIDTEVKNASASRPVTHRYAYRRQTAVNRHTHLMRTGDPLFAGLLRLACTDDRGHADAVWRHREGYAAQTGGTADVFFRCDILVEANLDPAMEMFPDDALSFTRRRALGRRLDLVLAPQYLTVWLDRVLQPVAPAFAAQWLENVDDGDTDLDATHWQRLHMSSGVNDALLAWEDLVAQVATAALSRVADDKALRQCSAAAGKRLRVQNTAHQARLESRLASLRGREQQLEQGRLAFERLLGQALQQGVERPQLRLDAIGAMFLSSRPLHAAA